METKFTSGNWCANLVGGRIIIAKEGGVTLAQLTMVKDPSGNGTVGNAYLMAASPEMYEAMQEFVDRCESGDVRSVKTYDKFKAILAKARGEL